MKPKPQHNDSPPQLGRREPCARRSMPSSDKNVRMRWRQSGRPQGRPAEIHSQGVGFSPPAFWPGATSLVTAGIAILHQVGSTIRADELQCLLTVEKSTRPDCMTVLAVP